MHSDSKIVLLADDDQDDRFLMAHAWKRSGLERTLRMVENGQQAVDYLAGDGPYADRDRYPQPCLAILDLKMPLKNGLEVLSWIRAREDIRSLPVIILSASMRPADIDEAYRRGVNSFLVKPSDLGSLDELVRAIKGFWLEQNQFPKRLEAGSAAR